MKPQNKWPVRRGGYSKDMTSLKEIVFENLDHALENGYFEPGEQLHGATSEEIAGDMIAYAEDVEDYEKADLLPHIEKWLKEKGSNHGSTG
jgi:hypothetical protein